MEKGVKPTALCGLNWSGTTYYDAWYFYRCAQMHRRLFVVAGRIAAELGEKVSSPEELEQRTQFAAVGGLTFHGVFGWVQQKDNYPVNQYGLKNPESNPHHFVYLYGDTARRKTVRTVSGDAMEDRTARNEKNCGATTRYRTDGNTTTA